MCPRSRWTRWTVLGGSLQSIIDNWNVLQELWDECLETKLEPDIKGRIIGVKHQMGTFDYFYSVYLGGILLKHSDNLSRAIQTSHMSAAEYQLLVALTTKTLTKVRTEGAFSLFWERCKKAATELKINEPVLPRKRPCHVRYVLGEVPSEFHDNVKHCYRQIYFESIDTVVNCIKSRFEQKDYVNCYVKVESTLLLAAKGESFDEHVLAIYSFYGDDLDQRNQHTQLTILGTLFGGFNNDSINIPFVINRLLAPARNTVSERSYSTLRRIRTYLNSTVTQSRLNHKLMLNTHKKALGELSLV